MNKYWDSDVEDKYRPMRVIDNIFIGPFISVFVIVAILLIVLPYWGAEMLAKRLWAWGQIHVLAHKLRKLKVDPPDVAGSPLRALVGREVFARRNRLAKLLADVAWERANDR